MPDHRPIWHELDDPKERAACVVSTVEALERTQAERRERCRRNVEIYEGRKLEGLFPSAYFTSAEIASEDYDVVRLNLARSLVQTAVAKIAGKQKPKAQMCVSDADWSTKRRAKRREKFVEAVMMQRQGALHDAWAVGLNAFRDCGVVDMGIIKFFADKKNRRIDILRVHPWEVYFDAFEARYGQPQNLFHVYGYDRRKLCSRFPKFKDEIMDAPSLEEDSQGAELYGHGGEVARMVKVREVWRLPVSQDEGDEGAKALVIGGQSGTDLTQDDERDGKAELYTLPFFPFEWIVWEPWMIGVHGSSIVDCVANLCEELNAAAQRWSDAERLGSNRVTYYERGSVKEEDLEDNRAAINIPVEPGTQMPPQTVANPTINATSIQWIEWAKSAAYEMPGISMMSATGQTDQGVTAAIAMRTQENVASERFAVQWQQYERMMAIGCSRQILACARTLADGDDFSVKRAHNGLLEELRLSDVDIDDDECEIQVYAVSGLINTPADRLQLASELYDRGILTKDAFLRVIQFKNIDEEIANSNRQSQLIDKYIESWLDATPEAEKSGKFRYRPPIPFMQHEEAILQVGRAYMDAEMDDAPDFNLGFFLRFMTECDKKIQDQQKQAAEMQALAMGKGPMTSGAGPTPPGMGAPGVLPAPPMPPPAGLPGAVMQ